MFKFRRIRSTKTLRVERGIAGAHFTTSTMHAANASDVYENAFGRRARVWGSGTGPVKRRGKFYDLLQIRSWRLVACSDQRSPRFVQDVLQQEREEIVTMPLGEIAQPFARADDRIECFALVWISHLKLLVRTGQHVAPIDVRIATTRIHFDRGCPVPGFEPLPDYVGLAPSATALMVIVTGIVAAIGAVWSR